MLKINEKFAKKYEEYRRKEELQKFKDKYGDVSLSEARKKSAEPAAAAAANGKSAAPADSNEEDNGDSSTSSESEDEDCEGWTPQTEAGFLRVYAALQTGDSRLYDPSVTWFQEEESEAANGRDEMDSSAHKPMFYNEYHRNFLLKGAYTQDDYDSTVAVTSEATRRDLREAERIRKSLADSHANPPDSGDSASDREDGLLVKKRGSGRRGPKNGADADDEPRDPMARLHQFVSDQGDDGEDLGLEPELKEDLATLKRRWTDERRLTDSERFLRDYITKEFWRPRSQATEPSAAGEEEPQLSDDENFLARQSEFEAKWNGRSEAAEPDEEFESRYRRTVASGEKPPADEDDEDDDADLFVPKQRADPVDDADEAEADVAVAADLRQLEKQRQWRLDGEGEAEEEAVEAAEAEAAGQSALEIRAYPRRIADSLRQATTDVARGQRRSERRERRRTEKMSRRRELARMVALKEAEVERRLERLRRNAGVAVAASEAADPVAATLGGDFLDADFDPAEHDERMAKLFGENFYGEGDGDSAVPDAKKTRRPVFSDDEELAGPEDAEVEAQRLRDEVDRMHAEDLIRAGPGQADLRCRFNYRQVEPNDFGLSAVEILLADDRELNAWCSVRKASQYRERDADRRDRRRFRSARSQARKASLMPGMLRQLDAAAAFPDPESWAAAVATATTSGDGEAPVPAGTDTAAKRRRRKKKKQLQQQQTTRESMITDQPNDGDAEARPRCRKRLKLSAPTAAAAETTVTVEAADSPESNQPKRKQKKPKPGLKITEQRLQELGIDPKKFRRMRHQLGKAKAKAKAGDAVEGLNAD